MVSLKVVIKKFDSKGEKTGWSYLEIPAAIATKLHNDDKKSFRVKGMIDECRINALALLPMGEGNYIMALNASLRKALKKKPGDIVKLQIEPDCSEIIVPEELEQCFDDEPVAREYFFQLKKGERNYFIKWIMSAKSDTTRAKRIAMAINAIVKKMDFGAMLRQEKNDRIA